MRRYRSSGRRSYGFRFRRPLARKKLIWTVATWATTDIAASAGRATLCSSGQWVLNATTGNLERARVEKIMFTANVSAGSGNLSRAGFLYALYVDDADASSPGDPATTTFWDAVQPFHVGQFVVPQFSAGVPVAGTFGDNNIADSLRVFPVKRRIRTDQSVFISIQSAANFNPTDTVSFDGIARVLLSLD